MAWPPPPPTTSRIRLGETASPIEREEEPACDVVVVALERGRDLLAIGDVLAAGHAHLLDQGVDIPLVDHAGGLDAAGLVAVAGVLVDQFGQALGGDRLGGRTTGGKRA